MLEMKSKHHSGGKIKNASDRMVYKPLTSKGDIKILENKGLAKDARINSAMRYIQIEQEITKESGRRYPNKDCIENMKKILQELQPYYLDFCKNNGMQK